MEASGITWLADLCCIWRSETKMPRRVCTIYIMHACAMATWRSVAKRIPHTWLTSSIRGERGKTGWSVKSVQNMTVFHLDSISSRCCAWKIDGYLTSELVAEHSRCSSYHSVVTCLCSQIPLSSWTVQCCPDPLSISVVINVWFNMSVLRGLHMTVCLDPTSSVQRT